MLSKIRQRGPDETGYFFDETAAIGSVRLSIIDLKTGSQPLSDASGRYWIAYNGEVYNYKDLRAQLMAKGHRFATESDTEVVLLSYVEWGTDAFARFNGGFAAAIYDRVEKRLVLVRDRFGKRPLYYAVSGQSLVFGSEMKTFAGFPGIDFRWDAGQLASIFYCWTPINDQTGFRNIHQLPPASFLICEGRTARSQSDSDRQSEGCFQNCAPAPEVLIRQYADLRVDVDPFTGNEEEAVEITREKLTESVRLRLQSDVEVGVYLSGGLDSSITTQIAKELNNKEVRSFSVSFEDENFDEATYQKEASQFIGTRHTALRVTHEDIARDFPEAVYYSETPLFRTALVPLFALSKMVRDHGVKVVLTGEGSDEAFLGYDIFKETHLLHRIMNDADQEERDTLVGGLYPYLKHYNADNMRAIASTYELRAQQGEAPHWAHSMRFSNSLLSLRFLNVESDPASTIASYIAGKTEEYEGLSPVAKTQWLEFKTLLSGYLLSSQGDRMALSNGVENRCPFLDPDVVSFAFSLPFDYRLKCGRDEKHILKRAFKNKLPESVVSRWKQPYLAPDAVVFLSHSSPDYISCVLSLDDLEKVDVLNADFALKFVNKLKNRASGKISPRDNQAFLFLLSLCLLDQYYVKGGHPRLSEFAEMRNVVVAVDGRKAPSFV